MQSALQTIHRALAITGCIMAVVLTYNSFCPEIPPAPRKAVVASGRNDLQLQFTTMPVTITEGRDGISPTPLKVEAEPGDTEVSTASGLRYVDQKVGTGITPKVGQQITVHYVGTLTNGKKFDRSHDRGMPFTCNIGVGQVIPGWDEGVMSMKVGGKRKLIVPSNLAYGPGGTPDGTIPPNATLIFEVELLGVK